VTVRLQDDLIFMSQGLPSQPQAPVPLVSWKLEQQVPSPPGEGVGCLLPADFLLHPTAAVLSLAI